MGRYTGFLGLVVILAFAWLCSNHKRAIRPRTVAWGLGLQFAFALLVLKTGFGRVFQAIGAGVNAMLGFTEEGSKFVFGPQLGASTGPFGVVFAFQVLPTIIFIASFFSILYYLGVMQWVVKGMAIGMQKVMGVSGAESLDVAALFEEPDMPAECGGLKPGHQTQLREPDRGGLHDAAEHRDAGKTQRDPGPSGVEHVEAPAVGELGEGCHSPVDSAAAGGIRGHRPSLSRIQLLQCVN